MSKFTNNEIMSRGLIHNIINDCKTNEKLLKTIEMIINKYN